RVATAISRLPLPDALPIYTGGGAGRGRGGVRERAPVRAGAAAVRGCGAAVAGARGGGRGGRGCGHAGGVAAAGGRRWDGAPVRRDRKSTRLNSSHVKISYA